jgi:hypothetical protein
MLSNLLHSQRFSSSAKAQYWQSAPAQLCVPRIFRLNRVASSLFLRLFFYLNNKKQACSTPLFLISFCSSSQYNECTHFTPIGCACRFLNRKTGRATNVPNGFHNSHHFCFYLSISGEQISFQLHRIFCSSIK